MTLTLDETTLQIVRTFDAPPQRVFDAWTDREQWKAWIGPEGMHCEVPLLDARVGGRFEVKMQLSDGNIVPVAGEFRTVEPPRRLVFTWGWDGDPERTSLITLSFRDVGGRTEMTLRQEGLGSVENRNAHGKGWNSALNKLAAFVSARP